MLYISILLSIWFVCCVYAFFYFQDFTESISEFLQNISGEVDEDAAALLDKSNAIQVLHLSCDKCNKTWWSVNDVNYCPYCGAKKNG